MLRFLKIDINKHRERVVKFRKDSFKVSFGDVSAFGEESDYLHWLEEKISEFPEGFVLVEEDGKLIGQLELSVRLYKDKYIGYVHLYYLIPEKRGNGRGNELHNYAKKFFRRNNVEEYHLRVAPANASAVKFYQKMGMVEAGAEVGGKVIRMKGKL